MANVTASAWRCRRPSGGPAGLGFDPGLDQLCVGVAVLQCCAGVDQRVGCQRPCGADAQRPPVRRPSDPCGVELLPRDDHAKGSPATTTNRCNTPREAPKGERPPTRGLSRRSRNVELARRDSVLNLRRIELLDRRRCLGLTGCDWSPAVAVMVRYRVYRNPATRDKDLGPGDGLVRRDGCGVEESVTYSS